MSLLSVLTLLEATIAHVWMAMKAMDSTVQVLSVTGWPVEKLVLCMQMLAEKDIVVSEILTNACVCLCA